MTVSHYENGLWTVREDERQGEIEESAEKELIAR